MATSDSNNPRIEDSAGWARRKGVAARASYEIESILIVLQQLNSDESVFKNDDVGELSFRRGMNVRLKQLNSIIMSVVGGEDDLDVAHMERVVLGETETEAEHE